MKPTSQLADTPSLDRSIIDPLGERGASSAPTAATPEDAALAELDHIRDELNAIQSALAQSQRLTTLGTLASILAHEYNNLLTPIASHTQLALSRPNDHALAAKALQRAHDAARQAAAISESVLGFARDADRPAATALLPQVIDNALRCLARPLSKDNIELRIDMSAITVAMQPIKLQQVLLNLILNARKAMGRKGGKLDIVARSRMDGNERVRITVSDTGPGIPAEIRDRVFEAFVTQPTMHADDTPSDQPAKKGDGATADKNATGVEDGTGLGLCVCRHLINQAGGSITCESESGRGATFVIDLPVARANAPARSRTAAA